MPTDTKVRKLEVYALHGRNDDRPANYERLFEMLIRVPPAKRALKVGDKVIVIPRLKKDGSRILVSAVEGAEGTNPLIFNTASAAERTEDLQPGEVVAEKTHAVLDLQTREGIIEYNQRGAKASDIAEVLESVARRKNEWSSLALELNPVADVEFVRAIERFDRIQLASIKVARPNQDWNDYYNDFTHLADESDARLVEIQLTAQPRNSLSKDYGIVHYLKELAAAPLAVMKGAHIKGVRHGEKAPTTISLSHYIEHQRVSVRITDDGHVQSGDIDRKMIEYLNARQNRAR